MFPTDRTLGNSCAGQAVTRVGGEARPVRRLSTFIAGLPSVRSFLPTLGKRKIPCLRQILMRTVAPWRRKRQGGRMAQSAPRRMADVQSLPRLRPSPRRFLIPWENASTGQPLGRPPGSLGDYPAIQLPSPGRSRLPDYYPAKDAGGSWQADRTH